MNNTRLIFLILLSLQILNKPIFSQYNLTVADMVKIQSASIGTTQEILLSKGFTFIKKEDYGNVTDGYKFAYGYDRATGAASAFLIKHKSRFDGSDCQVDFYHSDSRKQSEMVEWVKDRGFKKINEVEDLRFASHPNNLVIEYDNTYTIIRFITYYNQDELHTYHIWVHKRE